MKIVENMRPDTLQEAQKILQELGASGLPVAGATALHFMPGSSERVALDLRDIGLEGITQIEDLFSVGAMTTITNLSRFKAEGWVLGGPACCLATHQVRNQSTIGGNISRVFPWSDFPVILMALDAQIVTNDGAEKRTGADEFFRGQPASRLVNGCLVTAIEVPVVQAPFGFGHRKQRRTASGFSLMTAVCYLELEGETIRSARLAAGGALPYPRRLEVLGDALAGMSVEPQRIAECVSSQISNWNWKGQEGETDEYAAHLAQVLLSDAINEAVEMAKGGVQ